ncbi:MAG: hypothetical protein AAGL69_11795 [Pseudomonadota bacterium]
MSPFNDLQKLFFVILSVILIWLLVNGWRRQIVWVKGVRDVRSSNPRDWASQVSRIDNPQAYWAAMGFYALGLLFAVSCMLIFW